MAKSNVGKKPISEEEYTTNKVLTVFSICLLGVLVLMVLQRLLNYGSTVMAGFLDASRSCWESASLGRRGASGCWHASFQATSGARRLICGRNVLIVSIVIILSMSVINYLGIAADQGALCGASGAGGILSGRSTSYAPEFFLIAVDRASRLD